VIIPDSILWYLPFELLWGDRFRITYASTPGLGLRPQRSVRNELPIGVVDAGLLSPDSPEENDRWMQRMLQSIAEPQMLPTSPLIPACRLGSTVGDLVVLGVVDSDPDNVLRTTPGLFDASLPDAMLRRWMSIDADPAGGIVLPGYRSGAIAKRLGDGRELMQLITAIHCSGVENVVVSRWPVGGESTALLLNEYLKEAAFVTPESAWNRALRVLRRTQIDPNNEPLLRNRKIKTGHEAPPAIWAGYMIDVGL
jgi:hypothetical protein